MLHAKSLQSHLTLYNLWTVARQAPLSVGFSRQDTGVDCHFLLQGIFPTQGSHLPLLCQSPALADGFLQLAPPGKLPCKARLGLMDYENHTLQSPIKILETCRKHRIDWT